MGKSKVDGVMLLKIKLSAYSHLVSMIEACELHLYELDHKMKGIRSSANFQELRLENKPYENLIIKYQTKHDEWNKKLIKYKADLHEVSNIIYSIECDETRELIKDFYVERLPMTDIELKYNLSQNEGYRAVNKTLHKLLTLTS